MKTLFIILTLLVSSLASVFAGNDKESVIILEGKYQQRNIYIAQAIGSEGFGFCAFEIRVNGSLVTDGINSSAFEIDLSPFNFKLGDQILIEIRHKSGCTPKILNPGGLKPKPTFNTIDIKIDKNQILEWITEDEYGSLPFIIQQYKWNKWVNLGEVQGEGMPSIANYAFYVDLTSGLNKFRVVQIDQAGSIKKSKSVELESTEPALTQTYNKKSKKVIFSSDTGYEIHNKYGELIAKGFGSEANVKDLVSDNYWLSFDNTTVALKK
ncbi:MAG: hypothetical protein ACI8Q1_002905 [Parvicella sp.]|jgi:hypothetical protein